MTFQAQAFPVSPISPVQTSSDIVQVRGGCGLGWHRGPYGGCRRNWARGARAFAGPRCWFRRTPWGPRRVCRW
ncbi:hypothetical protein CAK95_08170 [Pseudorhodoplanes sinuspersici]|uniref:Uncharacterized protein n=2 Tax=Pseudorhodoplanes sinuspersici TaxID=1235591 RepID=A0A1W7A0C6_9HYPH|nr:hypothetical protein CAK95_08170 [Pseudorhodoplanes sinuspersici]